jgi:hypothetical protein
VNVVLGGLGQIVVDDAGHGVDVETSGRHIGGHENAGLAGTELGEDPVPLGLALVAVERVAGETFVKKLVGQIFGSAFCAGKDEGLSFGRLGLGEDRLEKTPLLGSMADRHDLLVDGDWGGAGCFQADQDGVFLVGLGQHLDPGRKGCRKEKRLALRVKSLQDRFDVGKESHVEHPVRFVENDGMDMGEVDGPTLHVVDQATGGRDDQIPGSAKEINLTTHVGATDEKDGPAPKVFAVFPGGAFNLSRQLPGGGEDEDLMAGSVSLGSLVPVKGGKKKASGLSGSRLSHTEDIPAFNDRGDGLSLNGGGGFVFEVGKSAQKIRIEAKGLK